MSLSDLIILAAIRAGYFANKEGNVYNPLGVQIKGSPKKQGHISITLPSFGIVSRPNQPVLLHRFVAFYFFGDIVSEFECVRHRDDIPTNNKLTNLALGSISDNRNDYYKNKKPEWTNAQREALLQRCQKLNNEQLKSLIVERKELQTPYYILGPKYGITTMTAYRICNRKVTYLES